MRPSAAARRPACTRGRAAPCTHGAARPRTGAPARGAGRQGDGRRGSRAFGRPGPPAAPDGCPRRPGRSGGHPRVVSGRDRLLAPPCPQGGPGPAPGAADARPQSRATGSQGRATGSQGPVRARQGPVRAREVAAPPQPARRRGPCRSPLGRRSSARAGAARPLAAGCLSVPAGSTPGPPADVPVTAVPLNNGIRGAGAGKPAENPEDLDGSSLRAGRVMTPPVDTCILFGGHALRRTERIFTRLADTAEREPGKASRNVRSPRFLQVSWRFAIPVTGGGSAGAAAAGFPPARGRGVLVPDRA